MNFIMEVVVTDRFHCIYLYRSCIPLYHHHQHHHRHGHGHGHGHGHRHRPPV